MRERKMYCVPINIRRKMRYIRSVRNVLCKEKHFRVLLQGCQMDEFGNEEELSSIAYCAYLSTLSNS